MLDSIIDPFGTATDQKSFLNFEEFFEVDLGRDESGITFN